MRLLRKGTPDLSSSEKERDHFRKGQEEKRPTEKPTTEKSVTVIGSEKDLCNSKRSWHFTHAHWHSAWHIIDAYYIFAEEKTPY